MTKLFRFLKARLDGRRKRQVKRELIAQFKGVVDEIRREDWARSLQDPTAYYNYCLHHFVTRLPAELRAHREYFSLERRGFGEDAFHTMWYSIMRELRPANFLEIGVFRGQTISLVTMLSQMNSTPCEVWGISPFTGAEDSVSKFPKGLDYYTDTLANFDHFKLPHPRLLRAFSTDPKAVELIRSRQWNLIFIDGNHDYPIVKQDWENCSAQIKVGGVIILDDSGLTTSYQPPIFAFGGWPDPSRIAQEIDRTKFQEILQVGHNRAFQRIA